MADLAASSLLALKLLLPQAGIYEVPFEDLASAGLPAGLERGRLRLRRHERPLGFALEDDGDGRFGSGDRLLFLAPQLRGHRSFHHEHARFDVAWLTWGAAAEPEPAEAPAPPAVFEAPALWTEEHLEVDRLRLRFGSSGEDHPEPWYWARLDTLQSSFEQVLALTDACRDCPEPVALRVGLRGWSSQLRHRPDDAALPDHRVELTIDGDPLGAAEWNGQEAFELAISVPAELAADGELSLALRVPRRRSAPGADPMVDVSLLNWIELRYRRRPWVGETPVRFRLEAADAPRALVLETPPGRELAAFAGSGAPLPAFAVEKGEGAWRHAFPVPAGESEVAAAPRGARLAVAGIERDRPSDLRHPGRSIDYVMIAHRTLIEAVEPLAQFHRRRGLSVEVVDVEDVYDEFSAGVVEPAALRDFLAYARSEWPPPAPRFVLLVGDASWDPLPDREDPIYASWAYRPQERRRFATSDHTPYADAGAVLRALVPTGTHSAGQGEFATDNWFVQLEPGSRMPVMAIGRLPVVHPEEVTAIVEKTIRYAEASGVGPWRHSVLWVTNQEAAFQKASDKVVGELLGSGYRSRKIYPGPELPPERQDQRQLREALDSGQLVVHFTGHGGRFIWRTGPPDLVNNRDLFDLEDIDALAPNDRLPLVISITCYSAPFDHPEADSIGEKFLRVAGRGAVGVVAASWRSTLALHFSRALFAALQSEATIGEAVAAAKRTVNDRTVVELYNLLGDPALPLARPALGLRLTAVGGVGGPGVRVELEPRLTGGRAQIDWLDEVGTLLASEELAVGGSLLERAVPSQLAPAAVHVYAWNEAQGVDAMGGLDLRSPPAARSSPH